jgi:hypothetical protein
MEPSGRNPWQSLANGTASKTMVRRAMKEGLLQ